MARQYIPFNHKINNLNLIIYPVKDESPLTNIFKNKEEIKNHLNDLYKKNSFLEKGDYHIIFVWNLEEQRMTDVWTHNLKNWSDSGPLIECYTFRGFEKCQDAGIASGDSIIVLGREEELRRKSKNMTQYLDRNLQLPDFEADMYPCSSF